MFNRLFKKIAKVAVLTVFVSGIAATLGSSSAFAAQITCAPILIEYGGFPSANTLIVQCAGPVNYYGWITPPAGCGNAQNADTIKAWQSIAQGALLAGKSVQIYYTAAGGTCSGFNSISGLDLIK